MLGVFSGYDQRFNPSEKQTSSRYPTFRLSLFVAYQIVNVSLLLFRILLIVFYHHTMDDLLLLVQVVSSAANKKL